MIELFERPNDPPFFGSYHLLNASIIYPDLFAPLAGKMGKAKPLFAEQYKDTWYQWCKNAGFALIYGCQEETFDRTARKRGAYALLRENLPNLFKLADRWIAFAERHGCVETMPDRELGRGYRIECSRSEWGRISPTIPLNYHVSGTAMQCTNKAMVRCNRQLNEWRSSTFDAFITLQVHDEIVFDFPKGGVRNLPKVRRLKALMEQSGDDIGVPLKVSVSYHPNNWGEPVVLGGP
jgi:DNA polymerase I-like protein with 3'-5' exonuclease and polymerase domains